MKMSYKARELKRAHGLTTGASVKEIKAEPTEGYLERHIQRRERELSIGRELARTESKIEIAGLSYRGLIDPFLRQPCHSAR